MNLIIDEGNTRIKLAVFNKDHLIEIQLSTIETCEEKLNEMILKYKFHSLMISSVTDKILHFVANLSISNKFILSNTTPVPFKNLYNTPKTLGVDRIALTTAACIKYPKQNTLIIDAGTCITYDFINDDGAYLGGAIAPGLTMRYKSMQVFTQKLPLLKPKEESIFFLGTTTEDSMHSGVLNGMVFEIDGMIESYQQKYGHINIILTGGDANLLYKQLKNSIFVNLNFLLEGLNEVLTYQHKDEI